jgi:hypothetical protein
MPLNKLSGPHLKVADRMVGTVLGLWGYCCALALGFDKVGWNDPVFSVVHMVPFGLPLWGAILAVFITIYVVGEIAAEDYPHRGQIIIFGAALTMLWHVALTLCMARVVYTQPHRVTILWPVVILIIATLYATRVIVYSNIFHGKRWNTNPYQLWATTFLVIVSLSQVVIGVAPTSVFTEVERPVAFQVALVNFIGAAVVLFGLHLRNEARGVMLELAGTFSLVATLGWYIALVLRKESLAGTTLGFGLAEAYLLATLHRAMQVLTLMYARQSNRPELEHKMTQALRPTTTVVERPVTAGDD